MKILSIAFIPLLAVLFVGNIHTGIINMAYSFSPVTVPNDQPSGGLVDSSGNPVNQLIPTQQQAPTLNTASAPSYTVGVNDPGTLAAYQQQIDQYNQALQGLPTQLQGSQNQIQGAYQTALNQLLGQKNQATAGYQTGTTGNQQSYVTNKNTIGANAGQSLNGLERLLGSRGAGGSSAALFSAPQAVAQQATAQRAGAGQTYGQNQQGLDTSYNNYLTQNSNDLNSIGSQRDQNLNSANAQSAQQSAQLNQQLATLQAQLAAAQGGNATTAAQPYLDQANALLQSAGKLGLNTFTPQYNTAAYQAPTAASYTANQFAAPVTGNPQAGIINNTVSPALQSLLKPKLSGVSA